TGTQPSPPYHPAADAATAHTPRPARPRRIPGDTHHRSPTAPRDCPQQGTDPDSCAHLPGRDTHHFSQHHTARPSNTTAGGPRPTAPPTKPRETVHIFDKHTAERQPNRTDTAPVPRALRSFTRSNQTGLDQLFPVAFQIIHHTGAAPPVPVFAV